MAAGQAGWRAAHRPAIMPPRLCPATAASPRPSVVVTRSRSSRTVFQVQGPSPERPWPRRSTVTGRTPCRWGRIGSQLRRLPPAPWSSSRGGPSPPWSCTAMGTPPCASPSRTVSMHPSGVESFADGACGDAAVGVALELAAPDQVVHALAGDAEHRAGDRVGDVVGARVPDAPGDGAAQRGVPPLGRRVEGGVARVQDGDQPRAGVRGAGGVGAGQVGRPGGGLLPGLFGPLLRRRGRGAVAEEDVQRVEQPACDQPEDVLFECLVLVVVHAASRHYLTHYSKYLTLTVKGCARVRSRPVPGPWGRRVRG